MTKFGLSESKAMLASALQTAGGGAIPRLARVMTCLMLMLTGLASGAWADVTFHKVTSIGVVAMAEMTSVGSGCSFDEAKAWVNANQAGLDKGDYTFFVYSVAGETYNTVAMQGSNVTDQSISLDASTLAQYHQALNVVFYALGEAPETAVCNDNFVRLTSDVSEDDLKKTIVNATDEQLLAFVRTLTKNGNPQFVVTGYDQSADTYSVYRADTQQSASISYADLMSQVSSNSAWIFSYLKAPTYSVTLADGTEDADQWKAQVGGTGAFTVLPVDGIEEGKTVTIQYNGTRRIKSITAVQTAAAEEQQEEAVTLATPLTMECLADGTIKVDMGDGTLSSGMQYAVNGGAKTKITTTTTIEGLTTGDKVQFYGVGTSTQVYGGDTEVKISGGTATVKVYGNIMSLLDEENFATKTDLPSSQYVFYGLFYGNAKLTDASGLLLPATALASNCYQEMFCQCTALTAAPALPATTLAEGCYYYMFYECTALTAAPELPATTLAVNCYTYMFYGCSKLASVTCKATNISASMCLNNWLKNAGTDASVTSPTLYVDPTMKENTGWNNGNFTVKALPGK